MSSGVGGLADEQRPARTLGEMRGDRSDELLVTRIEHRLAWLAVQAEHAPHFPGWRADRERLLAIKQWWDPENQFRLGHAIVAPR
jgi:hypothetical protein